MIKVYHTYDVMFITSEFMEEILKKHQKIRFSGAGASHQNGSEERTIKMVVTMASTMLMHAAQIWPKDTLYTIFFQRKWNMLCGSTVRSMIFSMVYKLLVKFDPYIFRIQRCISL